jgi:hypothetical protein
MEASFLEGALGGLSQTPHGRWVIIIDSRAGSVNADSMSCDFKGADVINNCSGYSFIRRAAGV